MCQYGQGGVQKVQIGGAEDKRQITAVFAATMEGDFNGGRFPSTLTVLSYHLFTINKVP